jgi:hypothetical protein
MVHLDECDGPLGAAGAHPPAHGELLADPRGAFVLPALHFRHPYPPPELPHGLPRRLRRSSSGGRRGGLRGGAVAAPPGGGGERRRGQEGEPSKGQVPGAPEAARCQPEKTAGGSGGRHRGGLTELGFTAIAAYLLLAF